MRYETKLLTPRDVASSLGLKPRTIARWCREGQFVSARKVGRVWRIRESDKYLQHLVQQQGYGDERS